MKKAKPVEAFIRMILGMTMIFVLLSCSNKKSDNAASRSDSVAAAVKTTVTDPLPSWNEGLTKTAIIQFVDRVTQSGSADFIPETDRIATFDNDGTLWSEQPLYFQFFFMFDRVKALAPKHPEWRNKEPFRSVLKGDIKSVLAGGERSFGPLLVATQTGMTEAQYNTIVKDWISTATHPTRKRRYTELVFQPMLELLGYLRSNGFKTFIVTGGEIGFMRAWSENIYGIPPYQVVGTEFKLKYDVQHDTAFILRMPSLNFVDDGPGKPIGIQQFIGKKPVFAAGNSDGDYEMLQYVTNGTGPRMGIIVHHTDSTREWAYDRKSSIGRLDRGLNDAAKYGWILVDMKKDWKRIYSFEKK